MPKKITMRQNGTALLQVSDGYDASGKQIVRTKIVPVAGTREAQKEYAKFYLTVKQQKNMAPTMTLREFYSYWRERYCKEHNAAATMQIDSHVFRRIDQSLGKKRLAKITVNDVVKFFSSLDVAPSYKKKHYAVLNKMLNKAVQWQLIGDNPVSHVDAPKEPRSKKAIYDEEQCKTFLGLLKDEDMYHQLLCYIPIYAGLRRGEIFGLQFKHVKGNEITVEQSCEYVKSQGVFIKETKTGIVHTVTIPVFIAKLIEQRKEFIRAQMELLVNQWKGNSVLEENFIFCHEDGKITNPQSFNRWLTRFLTRHNIPHITPHSFRHMMATYLIGAGVDIQTVSGKLGHTNTITTQRVYSHLLKSKEKDTANLLERILTS